MKEIQNWNELDESEVGSYGLSKGIYVVRIVTVKDIDVKQYLEIKFDVIKGENTGIFKKMCNGDYTQWPNQGIYRCSYKDSATTFFKRFITAVQKSNQNYVWNWDETSLIGKLFVAVMGEEEYLTQEGDLRVSVKLQSVRSLDALVKGEIKVPELKKLRNKPTATETPVNTLSDGDLPF